MTMTTNVASAARAATDHLVAGGWAGTGVDEMMTSPSSSVSRRLCSHCAKRP